MKTNRNPGTQKTARLLARVSEANRPALEAHVEYSRGQDQMTENGIYSFCRPVEHADTLLKGKPFKTATSQDWLRVVSGFRTVYSSQSLRIRVVNLRKHIRYCFDVDDLEKSDDLGKKEGRAIEKALKVKREKPQTVGQVIPEADLIAILDGIPVRSSLKPAFPLEVRDRACLATLRASGFRGGEHVSVRLWGARRESSPLGPVYKISLDPEAEAEGLLKTGPRTLYIHDPRAVAALDAWLAVHPFKDDPNAFLWVNAETGGAMARFSTAGLRKLLTKAVAWAGIGKNFPAKLTPHDFRHTCATEKARLGWNEFQMCDYFGWAPGSKMPGDYVHLTLDDQRARILKDAQAAAQEAAKAAPSLAPNMAALVDLLHGLLSKANREPGEVPA